MHYSDSNVLLMKLGRAFRDCRQLKSVSLRRISNMTGVSIATMSALENFKSLPKIETIIKLFKSIGFSLDIVIGGESVSKSVSLVDYKKLDLHDVQKVQEYINYLAYKRRKEKIINNYIKRKQRNLKEVSY